MNSKTATPVIFLITGLIFGYLASRQNNYDAIIQVTDTPAKSSDGAFSYAPAVKKAAPAVVNIHTKKIIRERLMLFNDPIFDLFFNRGTHHLAPERKRTRTNLGSGVIVTANGLIITNNHVIRGADEIIVALNDGRTSRAIVVGTDKDTDIAVLKIELAGLPVISFADSSRLNVGDVTLAIGNPFGVGQTVTMGIISATGRSELGISNIENFIQTDASINPGNSGGALTDAYGNLIGINTAIFSKSGASHGIGFAIPANSVREILERIIKTGRRV